MSEEIKGIGFQRGGSANIYVHIRVFAGVDPMRTLVHTLDLDFNKFGKQRVNLQIVYSIQQYAPAHMFRFSP